MLVLTFTLQFLDLQSQLISVERVLDYTTLPDAELLDDTSTKRPPFDWPSAGCIEFRNVSMAYRAGMPASLHELSVHIPAQSKVRVLVCLISNLSCTQVCLCAGCCGRWALLAALAQASPRC